MKSKKRPYFFLLIAILLGSFFLYVLHTLNRLEIEEKTHTYLETLTENIHGDIILESFKIKIFPLPHLSIRNISFIMLNQNRGTIKSLEAYPKLLPLITGKIKIAKLKLTKPDIKISHPLEVIPLNLFPLSSLKTHLEDGFKQLKDKFPGIICQIRQGKIELNSKNAPSLYLTEINTTLKLPSEKFTLAIHCKSSLWENARLTFWINPENYEGSGVFDLTGVNIKDLPKNLFPKLSQYISILSGDLHLSFDFKHFSEISGQTNGLVSNMIIHPENHAPLPLRCKAFNGFFSLNENKIQLQMDKMLMTEPEASLSGRFVSDKSIPEVTLEVTGKKVNAASVRKTALALWGQYKTTRKIFDYVREGMIPEITFSGKAPTLKQFDAPGAIELDGTITDGRIYIPAAKLDLKDTYGEVSVYKGNLVGKNIETVLDNSHGTKGAFSIGLHGKKAPFYLETQVDADLSQLPPILLRLIKNPEFQREMKKVKNCKGRATGTLLLGDRMDAIRPVVNLTDFTLSADYLRTPLTISLNGNQFIYNQKRIEFKQAEGSWGRSEFNRTSAVFDWQNTPTLIWDFEKAHLFSKQIYPWLKSLDRFSASFQTLDSLSGPVMLKKTVVQGPLFHPEKWVYETSGSLMNMILSDTNNLPEPFSLNADFKATQNNLTLSQVLLSSQDTQLSGLVTLHGALNNYTQGTVSIDGAIGPRMLPWFTEKMHLPFQFHNEIQVALSDFDTSWTSGRENKFSGNLKFSNKTKVFIDGRKTNDRLLIKSLKFSNPQSDARMSFFKKDTERIFDFQGYLDGDSLKALIRHDKIFSGSLSGDFKARIFLDHPVNSRFYGSLDAQNLVLQDYQNFPFAFQTLKLTGQGQTCSVDTRFTFKNAGPHHITGSIYQLADDMAFDLALDSYGLTLEQIISYFQKINPEKDAAKLYPWPVKGDLYCTVQGLDYKDFTWSEVNANLRITPGAINIEVIDGALCNIQTPGHLVISPDYMQMDFSPFAKAQKLEHALSCLGGKAGLIEGTFSLNGEMVAGNLSADIANSLQGDFTFAADKGRIYKLSLLSKVFALLNITEIFRGKIPDLAEEGFAYESITANGTVTGTTITIKNAFIDGASMGIVVKGDIDTRQKYVNLNVLVAPLKTVDFIIKQTPIVKNLIKGAVVSIPIEIKGDLADPSIRTMAPADVDSGLLGILKNTLKLPVTLIQPFLNPEEQEEKKNEPHKPHN